MSVFQLIVNVVIAIVAFVILQWIFGYAPGVPKILTILVEIVAVILVFTQNAAARLGVS